MFAYDSARFRQIASFNNPNQLGYWSLLSLAIFWIIAGRVKIKWYVQAPVVLCLLYTAATSLSKSAMISTTLLCMLHFIKRPKLIWIGLLAPGTGLPRTGELGHRRARQRSLTDYRTAVG